MSERRTAAGTTSTGALAPELVDRLERWSDAGRAMLGELLERGGAPLRRVLLERALLAGHGPAELDAFARAVKSLSDRELREYCSVGLSGRWRRAPPDFATMLRAEADPLLAFELNGGYLRVDRQADERWLLPAEPGPRSGGEALALGADGPPAGRPVTRALGAEERGLDAQSGEHLSGSGKTAGLSAPPTSVRHASPSAASSAPRAFDSGDVLPEAMARGERGGLLGGSVSSGSAVMRRDGGFDEGPKEDAETPTPLLKAALAECTAPWGLRWAEFELDVRGGLPLEEALERAARASASGHPLPATVGPAVGQSRRVVLLVQQHRSGQVRAWQLYDALSAELAWANEGDLLARRELPFADKRNRRLTRLALPRGT